MSDLNRIQDELQVLAQNLVERARSGDAACEEQGIKIPEKLLTILPQCFMNTIETTTKLKEDGKSYIFTGDIPAMWLRDSSAQVIHYMPLASESTLIADLIAGLIAQQVAYIQIDPYANAFNEEPQEDAHYGNDLPEPSPWVWERKYEIDSLCYPLWLAWHYYRATSDHGPFDEDFLDVCKTILHLWKVEQNHSEDSDYWFTRTNCPPSDTLSHDGKGAPVKPTGMTWSGFRPSDDACVYGYLIPANMFAVVSLRYMAEILEDIYQEKALADEAIELADMIDAGINEYGIVDHEEFGPIYAYETDGFGNYVLMDDANVPSLLSIPYLGYTDADDAVYQNTRKFVLSKHNPYYFAGEVARGIGSPHTPDQYIWHIALSMQALTSKDSDEINAILETIARTDADTGFMHEGFHVDDPTQFTREWFAWSNSLFSSLLQQLITEGISDV